MVESPQIEVHCLSLDSNSSSDDDSEFECPSDCVKELNFTEHHLVGNVEGTKERGSEEDSKSDGKAGSESGALGIESSHEPTTLKFVVRSEVV